MKLERKATKHLSFKCCHGKILAHLSFFLLFSPSLGEWGMVSFQFSDSNPKRKRHLLQFLESQKLGRNCNGSVSWLGCLIETQHRWFKDWPIQTKGLVLGPILAFSCDTTRITGKDTCDFIRSGSPYNWHPFVGGSILRPSRLNNISYFNLFFSKKETSALCWLLLHYRGNPNQIQSCRKLIWIRCLLLNSSHKLRSLLFVYFWNY